VVMQLHLVVQTQSQDKHQAQLQHH